jgi:excisionase family DNA binding protein
MAEAVLDDEQRLLLTPEEAARRLAVGRTTVYELLSSGALRSVQIGRCRRVPVSALSAFVERLVDQASDRPMKPWPGESGRARMDAADDIDGPARLLGARHGS